MDKRHSAHISLKSFHVKEQPANSSPGDHRCEALMHPILAVMLGQCAG